MANTLLTPTAITREALRVLHNKLSFVANCDKQHDGETEMGKQKRGNTIAIRKPPQYTVSKTATLNTQSTVEESVTLTVGSQYHVDMDFTSAELAQDLTSFSSQIIEPAVKRLASEIDKDALSLAVKSVYQQVGSAGTTPASELVILQAKQKLVEHCAETDDLKLLVNPATEAAMVNHLTNLFNPSKNIANQYIKGSMGQALGFDWFTSQNIPTITAGTRTGTILVDGAVSTEGSTTIHVDGLGGATQTFKAGEVITVAGVYDVNPETKATLPNLKQFVITADATAAGSEVDLTVSPAMYTSTSGGLQNISAFPANDAAVTVTGTASTGYAKDLAFEKNAFTFATAPLPIPQGVHMAAREVQDGISIRLVSDYDINNDRFVSRFDVLWGFLAQRPELACRITN